MRGTGRFRTALALSAALLALPAAAAENVEVLHWWTSGGEAAALEVIKDAMEAQGYTWADSPIAGGGGAQAMATLRARVATGDPPIAVQMLGYDVLDWSGEDVLVDITSVAEAGKWDAVVPDAIKRFVIHDGAWIAAPVNIHSVNWMWFNKRLADKIGIDKAPETLDELWAALDKAKAAGVIAFAHGGNVFHETVVFDSVVAATGGLDFYRKAFEDLDPEALGSDTMRQAFDNYAKLVSYADDNHVGRDWNLATAMVINGEALMKVGGDWENGEFIAAKQVPFEDYLCARFPGTTDYVISNTDVFAFFKRSGEDEKAQKEMAALVMDPIVQAGFNQLKGSIPARLDVSGDGFGACAQLSIEQTKAANDTGNLVGSLTVRQLQPSVITAAYQDVVTQVFHGQLTPEEAVPALVEAIAAAKDQL